MTWRVLIALPLVAALSGCSAIQTEPSAPRTLPATPEALPYPAASYTGLAWLSDGSRYATVVRLDAFGEAVDELVMLTDDGVQVVEPPAVDDCLSHSVATASALPDGRLGYVLECPADGIDSTYSIRAFDPVGATDEELARVTFRVSAYTFAPDMERGFVSASSHICASLHRIVLGSEEPADVEVTAGDVTMNLADQPSPSSTCSAFGRADAPAWSPDGSTIAFFASPQSIGIHDLARLDVPWSLYLMDADELEPRAVLTDLISVLDLRWSPDGAWLAFSTSSYGDRSGTFAYSLSTDEVKHLSTDPLLGLAWSPDSTRLIGAFRSGAIGEHDNQTVVEVSVLDE